MLSKTRPDHSAKTGKPIGRASDAFLSQSLDQFSANPLGVMLSKEL
jgi:hypothetical protein